MNVIHFINMSATAMLTSGPFPVTNMGCIPSGLSSTQTNDTTAFHALVWGNAFVFALRMLESPFLRLRSNG